LCGDLFKMPGRVKRGGRSDRRLEMVRRGRIRMRERPFQHAMNDEVRIAANWRSEMRVLAEAESEVPERIGGVARLLERTQHEVRQDALFGLAEKLLHQALVVLRREVDVRGRKDGAHLTLAAMAARFRAASLRGGRNLAVAHGDFALVKIFDAQGISE